MSGGSWEYAFGRVNDVATRLLEEQDLPFVEDEHRLTFNNLKAEYSWRNLSPPPISDEEVRAYLVNRKALGKILEAASEALRVIEWHDSGDTGVEESAPRLEAQMLLIEAAVAERYTILKQEDSK